MIAKKQTYRGFSLLEVLFAVGISSVIFFIVIQIYISIKQHAHYQRASADLLERGRLVVHMLRAAISQAGFIGCPAVIHYPDMMQGNENQLLLTTDYQMMVIYRALGHGWQPDLPATIQGKVKAGTDVIKSQQLGPNLSSVQQDMTSNRQIMVSAMLKFKVGDTVMISDCGHVDIFEVASVHSEGENTWLMSASDLNYRYQQYATVGFIQTQIFYIRESPYQTQRGQPIYSLYLNNGNTLHEELVPGIKQLHGQILSHRPIDKPLTRITFNVSALDEDVLWRKRTEEQVSNEWDIIVALRN